MYLYLLSCVSIPPIKHTHSSNLPYITTPTHPHTHTGLKALLPPIRVVRGSRFNVDPSQPRDVDSFLAARLEASGRR
jgi:hypothetical protein